MGTSLIYGLGLLILLLAGSISFLIYTVKRKSKTGTVVALFTTLLLLSLCFTNTIDEYSITKKEVIADLEHIDVRLNDDFMILNNKISGMPERIQQTVILVSTKDKSTILNKIKNAANFVSLLNGEAISNHSHHGTSDNIMNSRFPGFYSRELYSHIDNYPTRIILSVNENSDTVSYQRIED
ncbi:MAG: hypothetical protein JNM21_11080 [Taibaiella sp.]|nr:hypothetical protein [Taibaiella sp.]